MKIYDHEINSVIVHRYCLAMLCMILIVFPIQ